MSRAKKDLDRHQQQRDSQLAKEKECQAIRQWWKTPSSSSMLAWVQSGGARGTSTGEVRPWSSRTNQSMLLNTADSTINLDTTAEEIEVLELDQDLTVEGHKACEEDADHSHPQAKDEMGKGKDNL